MDVHNNWNERRMAFARRIFAAQKKSLTLELEKGAAVLSGWSKRNVAFVRCIYHSAQADWPCIRADVDELFVCAQSDLQ